MQITAAVKYADRDTFSIEQLELEPPRAKEILVKIAGVGLCHTDIVFSGRTDGYSFPAVFGHEAAGLVSAVGAGVDIDPGASVLVTLVRACGRCAQCPTTQKHPNVPCGCMRNISSLAGGPQSRL